MQATTTGENRTGIATAEEGVSAMLEANGRWAPQEPIDTTLSDADRATYIAEAEAVGSIPPPATIQGMLKTGFDKLLGERPEMLMDKIGERMAFERTGTRLYDALIVKHDAVAANGDLPELPLPLSADPDSADAHAGATLRRIRDEEHAHFLMLTEVMRSLGGDPTAQTPCADVSATASSGLMQVVTDPRTTLAQSLNAVLIAELADNAGWELLIALAEQAGKADIAQQFHQAMAQEGEHLAVIKTWLTALVSTATATETAAA